jgi:Glyoxalase-like domain
VVALGRIKKICVDAVDPVSLGTFWATVLDYRLITDERGEGGLVDAGGAYRLWFNQVPELKSVKHRVHLDIYARALADLEELGATVVLPQGGDRNWTVMVDPEGGEFCAFLRVELPDRRLHGLVVDCADGSAQAKWWYDVLGGRYIDQEEWGTVADVPELPSMTFDFTPVPEPKIAPNRIHWDIAVDSIQPLVDRGATVLREQGDGGIDWTVLADPEGNEFCAFT